MQTTHLRNIIIIIVYITYKREMQHTLFAMELLPVVGKRRLAGPLTASPNTNTAVLQHKNTRNALHTKDMERK